MAEINANSKQRLSCIDMLNITGSDSNSSVVRVESFDTEYDNQPGKYVVLQARNLAECPGRVQGLREQDWKNTAVHTLFNLLRNMT